MVNSRKLWKLQDNLSRFVLRSLSCRSAANHGPSRSDAQPNETKFGKLFKKFELRQKSEQKRKRKEQKQRFPLHLRIQRDWTRSCSAPKTKWLRIRCSVKADRWRANCSLHRKNSQRIGSWKVSVGKTGTGMFLRNRSGMKTEQERVYKSLFNPNSAHK